MINENQILALGIFQAKYGIGRKEMAEKLNVTINTVNMWCEGYMELTEEDAERITKTFSVDIFDLIKT